MAAKNSSNGKGAGDNKKYANQDRKHRSGPGGNLATVEARYKQEKSDLPSQMFVPSEDQRKIVKIATAMGMPEQRIALAIHNNHTGKHISLELLHAAFPEELVVGAAEMDTLTSGVLAKKIRDGNMLAIIWYMKNRMGWRDQMDVNQVERRELKVEIKIEELARKLEGRGLPPKIFGIDLPPEIESNDRDAEVES